MIEVVTLLPEIGVAAGAVSGALADMYAGRQIAAERQRLVEEHGSEVIHDSGNSVFRRIGPLAIYGAVALGVLGATWAPDVPATVHRPQLELVIDHSGATALGSPSTLEKINGIANQFVDRKIDSEAVVSRSGEVRIVKTSDVSKDFAFGDALLDQALQTALDNTQRARDAEAGTVASDKKAAIVVVTNGNSIGEPEGVVAKAKAAGTVINIVNVEPDASNKVPSSKATSDKLKAIVTQTSGTYWDSANADPTKIREKIVSTLHSDKKPLKKPVNWPKRALGSLPLLGLPVMYSWRRRMSVNLKGINIEGEL